ncbi:MAG: alpha-L-fucosidase [Bacteroidota bacterium]
MIIRYAVMKPILTVIIALCMIVSRPAVIKASPTDGKNDSIQKADRIAAWQRDRFGLFVHWGLYAIPAGEWKGQKGAILRLELLDHA